MSEDETIRESPDGKNPRSKPPEDRPAPVSLAIDDRYKGATEIARGGMGRVLVATDSVLGRTVAVKEALSTDDETLRRFARETHITARLEHPSIVPVYDAGTASDGSPYYVMRKVSGRPLDQLIMGARTLEQRLALVPHVLAAAQAVAHAHERRILHRDLKPTNILVGVLGETVVIDWGLAKVMDEPDDEADAAAASMSIRIPNTGELHTRIGTVFGTPGFMAPEQVRGEGTDARGDVYALGATLYYLLAQRPPHAGSTGEDMMSAAMAGPPQSVTQFAPGTPPELVAIVEKALAFDNRVRYEDAGAFAADVQRFLAGQLVASHRYSARERVLRFVRRNRVAVLAVSFAVVTLAVVGTLSILSVIESRDRANEQSALATSRLHDSIASEEKANARADELLLTQARTLIRTDPTASVGLLKILAADPVRWARSWQRARGIAAAARAEGIAYELPGVDRPFHLELSPDGLRILESSIDGTVLLADLPRHTVRTVAGPTESHIGVWASDDHVVIAGATDMTVLELSTGHSKRVLFAAERDEMLGFQGMLVYTTVDKKLYRWTAATDKTELLDDRAPRWLEATTDGHYLYGTLDEGIARYDLTLPVPVRELLGPPGPYTSALDHETGAMWAVYDKQVGRFKEGEPTKWYPFDEQVIAIACNGDSTAMITGAGFFRLSRGKWQPFPVDTIDLSSAIKLTRHNFLVIVADGAINLIRGAMSPRINLPAIGLSRVTADPRSPYLVASTPGHMLVYDMRDQMPEPRRIKGTGSFVVGDQDQIVYSLSDGSWYADDLKKPDPRRIGLSPTMPDIGLSLSAVDGTMVAWSNIDVGRAVILHDGQSNTIPLNVSFAGVVSGGQIEVATMEGAYVEIDADARHRETLYSRHSDVDAIAYWNEWRAAIYVDGTVWRKNMTTGREDTLALTPAPPDRSVRLRIEDDGALTAPSGSSLVRWSADGTHEVTATFPSEILGESVSAKHIIVTTRDHTVYLYDVAAPHHVMAWLPSGQTTMFNSSYEVELASYQNAFGFPEIADLETGEHWPLGRHELLDSPSAFAISSSGNYLVLGVPYRNEIQIYPIDIPRTADETAAWLGRLTNAIVQDANSSTVTWPAADPAMLKP